MMTNPLVSVIVPIYNVEKYVEGCLDSILSQTYLNFETILVNDGSTDNSLDVCENWIQKNGDSRFKLLSIRNSGPANARNFGIEHCSLESEFVFFVDSDDIVATNYISSLLEFANDKNLVIGKLKKCLNKGELLQSSRYTEYNDIWNNLNFLDQLKNGILNSSCTKCFSLKIIRLFNIRFPLSYPEDLTFVLNYIDYVDSIIILDREIYYYFIRFGSVTSIGFEEIYINYMNLQERLYDKVYELDYKYIEAFVYPQYRANTMKFIKEGNYDIIKKYFSNKLIRDAFKSYAPTSFGDWLIHTLMRYKFFRTIRLLSRGK